MSSGDVIDFEQRRIERELTETAAKLSADMKQLAVELAAFNGTSPEDELAELRDELIERGIVHERDGRYFIGSGCLANGKQTEELDR